MKYLEAKALAGAPENKAFTAAAENKTAGATDAAEQLAWQLGVDLATVVGSGVEGRVTVPDVRAAAEQAAAAAAASPPAEE